MLVHCMLLQYLKILISRIIKIEKHCEALTLLNETRLLLLLPFCVLTSDRQYIMF